MYSVAVVKRSSIQTFDYFFGNACWVRRFQFMSAGSLTLVFLFFLFPPFDRNISFAKVWRVDIPSSVFFRVFRPSLTSIENRQSRFVFYCRWVFFCRHVGADRSLTWRYCIISERLISLTRRWPQTMRFGSIGRQISIRVVGVST